MIAARPLATACALALLLAAPRARAERPDPSGAPADAPSTDVGAPAPSPAPAGAPAAESRGAGGSARVEPATTSVVPAAPPPATGPLIGGPTPQKPREDEVRALERALMQRGGLLLPAWRLELAPEVGFSGADTEAAVATETGAYRGNARTQLLVGSATLRLGLPWDLQLEGSLPFGEARRTVSAAGQAWSQTRWGIGDVRLSLSYQLWRGSGRAPDVLVAATWKSATATSPFASPLPQWVTLGTGLVDLGGTVTVVKPADPLVLLGSVGVARSLPRDTPVGRVDAGIETTVALAAILAVSPDTSISMGLDQKYAPNLKLGGHSAPGTDRMAVSFDVGVAMLAWGTSFVQLTAALGLTRDVPAFQLGLSVPIRLR